MQLIKQIAAIALCAAFGPVMAESAFTGFYGQLSTGYEHNSVNSVRLVGTDYGGMPNTSTTATLGASGMPLVVGLGYSFKLDDRFVLGIGVDYSTLTQTTAAAGFSYPGTGSTASYNYHVTISNRFNVFLSPGYAIDDAKLVYLKLGYSNQKLQYSQTNCCSTPSNKANVDGIVLGLGYKQTISDGFYGFIEANYYAYSRADLSSTYTDGPGGTVSANPTSNAYNLLVGVGYAF